MVERSATPALRVLAEAGVSFILHEYVPDAGAETYGEGVAASLGVPPDRLFKTLVAEVDGRAVVAVVPVSGRLSLKELARAAGGKRAEMASRALAERVTGYVVGGISPLGQKRRLPTYCDASVGDHATVFVSAGRRGLQVELDPDALLRLTGATIADLTAP